MESFLANIKFVWIAILRLKKRFNVQFAFKKNMIKNPDLFTPKDVLNAIKKYFRRPHTRTVFHYIHIPFAISVTQSFSMKSSMSIKTNANFVWKKEIMLKLR